MHLLGLFFNLRAANGRMAPPCSTRGQTSVEFAVILAVVLIIGLLVIGLALFFSMGSSDISESDARTYWATQVRPMRISEMAGYHYTAGCDPGPCTYPSGEIALKIENVDSKPITLVGIRMEPDSGTYKAYKTHSDDGTEQTLWGTSTTANPRWTNGIAIAPGDMTTVYVRAANLCSDAGTNGASADRFKNYLTLYYETPDLVGLSFRGTLPIKGPCSPV